MREADLIQLLKSLEIQPSAQRVAIAKHVLTTKKHPTADEVWQTVKTDFPFVSRATVYNTLNLFVEKGLLRQHVLHEAGAVFDPNRSRHHHFLDVETGEIRDIPWEDLEVAGLDTLSDLEITEYMVLVRGRKKKTRGTHRQRRKEEKP
jgi:Fe2+ or Zn2+ uptake regulation protein